jgi:phosphate starvation-inducible protein PhoH and related proteins
LTEFTYLLDEISPLEFYGVNNKRLEQLKRRFPEVLFVARGNELRLKGPQQPLQIAAGLIEVLADELRVKGVIEDARYAALIGDEDEERFLQGDDTDFVLHGSNGNFIKPRTQGHRDIIEAARHNDIVFALGPAGTGKTYMSVALAVRALREKQVKKIFLVRPAVEAGENLGFLPGDLKEKIDPYLRPLYDALEDMIHNEKLRGYLEKNIIEIAPLAYMRGRTLSNCYVILDEAQNVTEMQFRMFLTRLGKGGKIIITGDDSQVDLPRHQRSGLRQAVRILQNTEGIGIVRLNETDVMRHKLVKKIITAYKHSDEQEAAWREEKRRERGVE